MFHHESPDEESAKKDPEHASRADTSLLQTSPENADIQQPRPKLARWRMTVRRLSEMERYGTAGRDNDVSSDSRTFAIENAALRKTEVGLPQSVEEVWFAGCHSDVGGQYFTFNLKLVPFILTTSTGGTVRDDCRYSLANISLRWMIKQVVLSQCGILFDNATLRRADIDISHINITDPHQPTVGDFWNKGSEMSKSPSTEPGPEDADDKNGHDAAELWPTDQDVVTDCHDALKGSKAWWMLEMLPTKYAWQEANGKWNAKWG